MISLPVFLTLIIDLIAGGEPVGLATNELMGEERDTQQPSLALGSASAVLGPERNKFTGISTGAAGGRESERAAVVGPNR